MFTVDAESQLGRRRIPNEEIAEAAQKNADIMIAFASIDPHKGKMGAREARRLIEEHGVKGFKFHPTVQGFHPARPHGLADLRGDRRAQAAGDVPQRPLGHRLRHALRRRPAAAVQQPDAARRCGDGLPRHADHRSRTRRWPWQDEALTLAMHKPNVWIDLSGWSPKYFPPQLVQYANTLLKDRMLFGSDFPLITPERWMKDFEEAGFKDKVKPLILKENAKRLLKLGA